MDDPYTSPDDSYSYGEASWNPALRPHDETPATAKAAYLIDDILAASGWDSIGASTHDHDDYDGYNKSQPSLESTDGHFSLNDPAAAQGQEVTKNNDLDFAGSDIIDPTNVAGQERAALGRLDTGMNGISSHQSHEDEETPVTARYEHQGSNSAADLAIAEAPTASLISDPEPLEDEQAVLIASGVERHIDTDAPTTIAQVTEDREAIEHQGTQDAVLTLQDGNVDIGDRTAQDFKATDGAFEWGSEDDGFGPPQTDDLDDAAAFFSGTPVTATAVKKDIDEAFGSSAPEISSAVPEGKPQDQDLWAAAFDDDGDLLESMSNTSEGNRGSNAASVDPSGFLVDDDDAGFLQDEGPSGAQIGDDFGAMLSQPQSHVQTASNNVAAYSHSRPSTTPATFLPGLAGQYATMADHAHRPVPKSSSSFADRSKEGYASPYDLPTDIVATKKRPSGPPARTSSVQSTTVFGQAQPPPPGPPVGAGSQPLPSPNIPTTSQTQSTSAQGRVGPVQAPTKMVPPKSTDFFADLPVNSRPKPRATPLSSYVQTPPPPPGPPNAMPPAFATPPPRPVPVQRATYQPAPVSGNLGLQDPTELRQPDRLPLYPDQSSPNLPPSQQGPPAPAASSRYSTAPVNAPITTNNRFSPGPPAAQLSRYASAPGPPTTNTQRVHSFIPKTSSPLAYHDGAPTSIARQPSLVSPTDTSEPVQNVLHRSRLSEQHDSLLQLSSQTLPRTMTPPQVPVSASSAHSSPRSSRYAPSTAGDAQSSTISPIRAVRTQSPLLAQKSPPLQRPASVDRQRPLASAKQQPNQPTPQPGLSLPSRSQFASDLSFQVPQDERRMDPLERWKGHPIFRWSSNGTLVSSLPKQSPFYAAGHAIPVLKCTSGPVIVHETKSTFPIPDVDSRFPGPLQGKGKGKKKDVVQWLSSKIEVMERQLGAELLDLDAPRLFKQKTEEKVILWKVMRLLVEHDNNLSSKPEVAESLRKLLVPNDIDEQSTITDSEMQISSTEAPKAIDISELRRLLFTGERDRAVWFATEKNLWSHAMLIASTMGPDIWKQLIHEFVKSQVKGAGNSLRSLAALYEVFGGNWEESTDELVPPSAQAGFSMLQASSAFGQSTGSSLDGLEKWRETLSLIISNRSANDAQAIAALGRLLERYGRVEAAHTCALLGNVMHCSGADDPESTFVLLGIDHKTTNAALGSDLDSILLTEVFEYAKSLAPSPGVASVMPHLQPYKFIHALKLAEHGLRSEAVAYCESIFSSIKASTRASPYFHTAFAGAVDELNRCLSQAPQTSTSSGLLAKFSSEKVSTGLFRGFTKFVAGEEDDASSNASGQGDAGEMGPFSKVSASPGVSRVASNADLYGAMSATVMHGQPSYSPNSPNIGLDASQQVLPYGAQALSNGIIPHAQPSVGGGRYAPHPTTLSSSRSVSGLRSYEPQRGNSNYATQAAVQRAPSRSYTPQSVPSPDSRQTGFSGQVGAPKPDPIRTASDVGALHNIAPIQDNKAMVGQQASPYMQPSSAGSPYMHRPSPLSETSSPQVHDGAVPSVPSSFSGHLQSGIDGVSQGLPYSVAAAQTNRESGDLMSERPFDHSSTSYEPPQASFEPPQTTYEPPQSSYEPPQTSYEPPQTSYDPPASSYEPPTASFNDDHQIRTEGDDHLFNNARTHSYEPSSYQPYEPDYANDGGPSGGDEARIKKKSIMDLSDDDVPNAAPADSQQTEAQRKAAERAEADRLADAAFRAAAEADAARDKEAKEAAKKAGWFGGWFGGKKDGANGGASGSGGGGADGQQPQKAIKAKLGEENSFYFDKELGKWVNKKAGAEEVKSTPTPPPPRGGPVSRVASGVGPPPPMGASGPPSRAASAAHLPGGAAGTPPPPSAGVARGTPPPPGPPGSVGPPGAGLAPPSRPSTSLSNASSIDDLIGPAGGKKGTVKGKKKGGRYVDVMAK